MIHTIKNTQTVNILSRANRKHGDVRMWFCADGTLTGTYPLRPDFWVAVSQYGRNVRVFRCMVPYDVQKRLADQHTQGGGR